MLGRENSLLRILQSWAPSSTSLPGKTTRRDDEIYNIHLCTEPVFVNHLRSPRIDSQPGGPVQLTYLSYRPAMLHRLSESNPRNRFLVSLNVYKYGLRLQVVFFYRGLRHLWKSCRRLRNLWNFWHKFADLNLSSDKTNLCTRRLLQNHVTSVLFPFLWFSL